jgi:hypothetical protein
MPFSWPLLRLAAAMVNLLKAQAIKNPRPFLALLGKVLPLQVNASMEADFIVIFGEKDAACL